MVKSLFSPAVWLVGRLCYRHKLFVTAAVFLFPLLVFAGLLIHEHHRSLVSTKAERAGLAVQLPALELLLAFHEHHAAVQAIHAGDDSYRQSLADRKTAVARALETLQRTTTEHFALSAGPGAWNSLSERWTNVAAAAPESGDSLAAHLELDQTLRNGLTRLSNSIANLAT